MTTIKTLRCRSDPVAFIREVERIWQARDGAKAAEGYTEDAVVYYGRGQSHTGDHLRNWPSRWFEYASDLKINKTYPRSPRQPALPGPGKVATPTPRPASILLNAGRKLFYLRGNKVYEHHMWQHSWPEDEVQKRCRILHGLTDLLVYLVLT